MPINPISSYQTIFWHHAGKKDYDHDEDDNLCDCQNDHTVHGNDNGDDNTDDDDVD